MAEEKNGNKEINEEINRSFDFFDNNWGDKIIYNDEEISEITTEIVESPAFSTGRHAPKSAPEIIKTLVSQNLLSDNLDLETTLDKLPF